MGGHSLHTKIEHFLFLNFSMLDLSFGQNLSETEQLELLLEITFNVYNVPFIFSPFATGRGYIGS